MGPREQPLQLLYYEMYKHREKLKEWYNHQPDAFHLDSTIINTLPKVHYKKNVLKWKSSRKEKPDDEWGSLSAQKTQVCREKGWDLVHKLEGLAFTLSDKAENSMHVGRWVNVMVRASSSLSEAAR